MRSVHVVVPDMVGDPTRPSGGNTYDRRLCAGLTALGWTVHEQQVPGEWPRSGTGSRAGLAAVLTAVPDRSVVLLDGLVASAAPDVVGAQGSRLRLVVLVHMPLGPGPTAGVGADHRAGECGVLTAASTVVTTSRWTRDWLLRAYPLAPARVVVVPPGTEAADAVSPSATGERLVCIGAVTPTKGQDILVEALAAVLDLPWSCRCVGSVLVDPAYADTVRERAKVVAPDARLTFTGPLVGHELDAVYAVADLVIAPSRTEAYGMVVTEALARGIPVVGADVGGLPEALGHAPGGGRPGLLVRSEEDRKSVV